MASTEWYKSLYLDIRNNPFTPSPIERLREQRKPTVTTKPQKPRPVTDEQLLAVVEQLEKKIKELRVGQESLREQIDGNHRYFLEKFQAFGRLGFLARLFSSRPFRVAS